MRRHPHSMAEMSCIIRPVLEKVKPKRIAEIGAGAGINSEVLADFLRPHQGELLSIDPAAHNDFLEWLKTNRDVATHICKPSLQGGIAHVGTADMWFIDGDHNWYSVYNELKQIESLAREQNKPLLIYLHDTGWPFARRDMYCSPESIPDIYRQPYASHLGIVLDHPHTVEGRGMKGTFALTEGGPQNGVLTGVEDFLKTSQTSFHWISIPAALGLGILIDKFHPLAQEIIDYYAPLHQHPLLAAIERSRVISYWEALESNNKLANANDKLAKLSSMLNKLGEFCEV
ncbi:MAG: class I SAM-dependent methyltransferase [Gammaproteobacteria bacterium]